MNKLPEEYIQFMKSDLPKEGELSVSPFWFQLWDLNKIEENNINYKTNNNIPGFIGIGSNGGEELIAFNSQYKVFAIPFIPMDKSEAVLIAENWNKFETFIKK